MATTTTRRPPGDTVVFTGNAAQVTGTSSSKNDKQFYVFTALTTGVLTVALEPREGGSSSGTANVVTGREYRMRLKSPDLAPVSHAVDLSIAPMT